MVERIDSIERGKIEMKISDYLTVGENIRLENDSLVPSIHTKGHKEGFNNKIVSINDEYVTLSLLGNPEIGVKLYDFDIVIDGRTEWGFRKVNDEKKDVKNIVPDYYNKGGIDVNEFAERKFPVDQLRGFYRINIIKYVTRYEDKNGVEDLIKAKTYLGKLIELEEKNK